MSKKLILVLIAIIFFPGFRFVFASVVISEVKISPTEDRFIKLYNQDSEAVDLTNWYIQRKTQTGTSFESLVSKTNFENKKINGSSYFLISRSQTQDSDIVLGTLTLTESNVIQIKNSNGEVVDKVCWGDVTDCGTSMPNPVSGQSIQFTDHASAAVSAPSSSGGTGVLTSSNVDNNSSVVNTTTTKNKITEEPKIKTQIISKTVGFVGLPLSLEAVAFGSSGERLSFGKYFWNFGDGDSKEINLMGSQLFTHTYFYPGEYIITLDYYGSSYQELPDASSQMTIKVVPADISISKVGDKNDFFVELTNNTDYPADLSNWILASDTKSFMIPRNTILVSKGKIIISPKITGFFIADQNTLKLMTPEREVVFEYGGAKENIIMVSSSPAKGRIEEGSFSTPAVSAIQPPASPLSGGENNTVLTASAVSSDIVPEKFGFPYILIISAIFIGASAYGVYFIRRKKSASQAGDDFEMLEE